MYERILVPTDGSNEAEKGVSHAIDLAATMDATIHALYVIEEGGNPWDPKPMEDQMEKAREYGLSITGEAADMAADAGVDAVTAVEVDPNVTKAINEYAAEENVDLIVMGTGYQGRFGSLLGSTTEKVLRAADVPVTAIKIGSRG